MLFTCHFTSDVTSPNQKPALKTKRFWQEKSLDKARYRRLSGGCCRRNGHEGRSSSTSAIRFFFISKGPVGGFFSKEVRSLYFKVCCLNHSYGGFSLVFSSCRFWLGEEQQGARVGGWRLGSGFGSLTQAGTLSEEVTLSEELEGKKWKSAVGAMVFVLFLFSFKVFQGGLICKKGVYCCGRLFFVLLVDCRGLATIPRFWSSSQTGSLVVLVRVIGNVLHGVEPPFYDISTELLLSLVRMLCRHHSQPCWKWSCPCPSLRVGR